VVTCISYAHITRYNGVSRPITSHHSSSVFYQDACRQGQDYSEIQVPVQARLQAGEVQSCHREGREGRFQLSRGDHWEGMAATHQGAAWSLEGMEEDHQEADPWLLGAA
jgi:hypothetical protein